MGKINKYANIYDKEGNLVRHTNIETHELDKVTIEEVEKLVDELTEKYKADPKNNDLAIQLNNAQKYLYYMYNNMSREDLLKRLSIAKDVVDKAKAERNETEQKILEQVNEEIDKLKEAYETEEPIMETMSDDMDEYVEYEESK